MDQKLGTCHKKEQKTVPRLWLYKTKHESNGKVDKFKTRYLAKDCIQIEGTEYSDTFAPTSKPDLLKFH